MSKKIQQKTSQSPTNSRQSTGTGSTTDILQRELEKFEAICAGIRAALDKDAVVADFDEQTIRKWKQSRMGDKDMMLCYDVGIYTHDQCIIRVQGSSDLLNVLEVSAMPEAPERFGFQFFGQIWQPLRTRFETLINSLHKNAVLRASPENTVDGNRQVSGGMPNPNTVYEAPAVKGVIPGTEDDVP